MMKELLKQTLETYRVGVGDSSNAVETTSVRCFQVGGVEVFNVQRLHEEMWS